MVAYEWSKKYEGKLGGSKQTSYLEAGEDRSVLFGIRWEKCSNICEEHVASQSATQKKDQDCFLFLRPLPFLSFLPLIYRRFGSLNR